MRRLVFAIGLVICFSLLVGSSMAYAAPPYHPITYYVNAAASGANNGTSWPDAFTDLQSALTSAVSGDQIWVAAGTYKPTSGTDRTISFSLKTGVDVYGGFAGDGNVLRKRSLDPSLTVLSGDIGTTGDDADNSYHVVYANGVTDAVLDGFTVTGGRADRRNDVSGRDCAGGGMYNNNSALSVANCIFSDNRAAGSPWAYGGGMYNNNSALTITNCTFSGNQAGNIDLNFDGRGGGMYNFGEYNNESSSIVTGCTFNGNVAWPSSLDDGGGGMYNRSCRPTIDRCTFTRNWAGYSGGGMVNFATAPTITNCVFNTNWASFYGGAILNVSSQASIVNDTFYKNGWAPVPNSPDLRPRTEAGGAIYEIRMSSTVVDCIFSGNAVHMFEGGAYANEDSRNEATLIRCLFYGNIWWQPDGQGSIDAYGDFTETNVLYDLDPYFVNPEGGDFHLQWFSPCIDAGLTPQEARPYVPPILPATDFEGDKRMVDGDGYNGKQADIGADEYMPNLTDLDAFIDTLSESGEIDATLTARLLAYVDAAQTALHAGHTSAAIGSLKALIGDAKESLGGTETAQAIEAKTLAVIQNLN